MNILRKIWKNYLSGFAKFNDFSGRATRSEFWSFTLMNAIFLWLSAFIDFTDPLFLSAIFILCVAAIIEGAIIWRIISIIFIILILTTQLNDFWGYMFVLGLSLTLMFVGNFICKIIGFAAIILALMPLDRSILQNHIANIENLPNYVLFLCLLLPFPALIIRRLREIAPVRNKTKGENK